MSAGAGAGARSSWSRMVLAAWLVLQVASGLLLVLLWFGLDLVVRHVAPDLEGFRTSWLAAFVLAPVGFLPVLGWWQGWAGRRYGSHPRTWRLVIEVAFALDVVGAVLLRGIA